jgi:hypothetical protein
VKNVFLLLEFKMKLDRTSVSISNFAHSEKEDRVTFWAMSPEQRMVVLEQNRRACYGDAATGRLQRVFEIIKR